MTDKPDAGEAARRIVETHDAYRIEQNKEDASTGPYLRALHAYEGARLDSGLLVARALLSSSKRIEELEKALGEFYEAERDVTKWENETPDNLDPTKVYKRIEKARKAARAALSPSNGGGEMAQPQTASRSPATKPSDV